MSLEYVEEDGYLRYTYHERKPQVAPEPLYQVAWRTLATGKEGVRPFKQPYSQAQGECLRFNDAFPGVNHWPLKVGNDYDYGKAKK